MSKKDLEKEVLFLYEKYRDNSPYVNLNIIRDLIAKEIQLNWNKNRYEKAREYVGDILFKNGLV